ncbi:unnamed protein product [Enterobius vermicularis]|uniref:ANK_REP_REGION domain-containing protein n=1 Tax=Enterobius vermicularis TaxID=51028 RepID=A0A0N4V4C8_ENTVE|nr:unnamed protein product [Enterobius vermicularis]
MKSSRQNCFNKIQDDRLPLFPTTELGAVYEALQWNVIQIVKEIIDVQRLSDLFLKYAKLGDSDSIRDALRHATNEEIKALASAKDTDKLTLLHHACRYGHSEIVELLVQNGANVNSEDNNFLTPLHYAARYNADNSSLKVENFVGLSDAIDRHRYHPILFELIKNNGKTSAKDKYGRTPLHYAAMEGNIRAARELITFNADVTAKDRNGMTPLHTAAAYGSLLVVRLLVDTGARILDTDSQGNTALHLAAKSGHRKIVQTILEAEKEQVILLEARNTSGDNVLHVAVDANSIDVVQYLLKCGCDVNGKGAMKNTALHSAASKGYRDIVEVLLKEILLESKKTLMNVQTSDTDHELALAKREVLEAQDKNGATPLLVAASKRRWETVRYLLEVVCTKFSKAEKNAFVNSCNSDLETPMHIAAACGHLKICEMLYDHHASFTSINKDKETPIHYAAKEGKTEVVSKLLEWDRKIVGDTNIDLNTPLHLAAMKGHTQVVEVLLDAGAEMMIANIYEQMPLDCAVHEGRLPVVELLLKRGAATESPWKWVETPLHRAADKGYAEIVRTLLRHKAQIDRFDKYGRTCLDIAIENNHPACCKVILEDDNWQAVMRSSRERFLETYETPMRSLIRKFPDLAELVFNKCLKLQYINDERDFILWCNYEFLDDSLMIKMAPKHPADWIKGNAFEEQEENFLKEAQPYSTDYDSIIANHPLKIMVFLLYQRHLKFFSPNNALEIAVYATSIIVVIDFNECSRATGLRMLEYQDIWWSLLKTTVMMTGEIEYHEIFFDSDSPNKTVFTRPWINIALVFFVIIMIILLMDLLVGVVDNINVEKEKAELTSIAIQSLSTKSRKEKRELRKQLSSLGESITKTEKATEEVQNELLLLKEALKKSERQLWEELLSLKESINTQLVRQQQTLAIISNQLNT